MTQTPNAATNTTDLFGQTVRTMAILVGSCVLFVGALSVSAVAITNMAVGPRSEHAGSQQQQPEAPTKTSPKSI
jgi:hypothetical protein